MIYLESRIHSHSFMTIPETIILPQENSCRGRFKNWRVKQYLNSANRNVKRQLRLEYRSHHGSPQHRREASQELPSVTARIITQRNKAYTLSGILTQNCPPHIKTLLTKEPGVAFPFPLKKHANEEQRITIRTIRLQEKELRTQAQQIVNNQKELHNSNLSEERRRELQTDNESIFTQILQQQLQIIQSISQHNLLLPIEIVHNIPESLTRIYTTYSNLHLLGHLPSYNQSQAQAIAPPPYSELQESPIPSHHSSFLQEQNFPEIPVAVSTCVQSYPPPLYDQDSHTLSSSSYEAPPPYSTNDTIMTTTQL